MKIHLNTGIQVLEPMILKRRVNYWNNQRYIYLHILNMWLTSCLHSKWSTVPRVARTRFFRDKQILSFNRTMRIHLNRKFGIKLAMQANLRENDKNRFSNYFTLGTVQIIHQTFQIIHITGSVTGWAWKDISTLLFSIVIFLVRLEMTTNWWGGGWDIQKQQAHHI